MKKIFFLLAFVLGCVSAQAQVIEIYKNGTLENTYCNTGDDNYKVVVKAGKSSSDDGKTHETVDLGLSVKWATCNVGASSAYDVGSYFAWGEVESRTDYTGEWSAYKYATALDNMTKYNSTDNKTVLDSEDDAATVSWGSSYRMPTKAEFQELVEKCTWTWDDTNKGFSVKASNGNSIFLPAAGWYDWRSSVVGKDVSGYYWSSTLNFNAKDRNTAFRLQFSSATTSDGQEFPESYYYQYTCSRYFGCSVRPVAEP